MAILGIFLIIICANGAAAENFSAGTVEYGTSIFPCVTIKHVNKVFESEPRTPAHSIEVVLSRKNETLTGLVWTRRGKNAIAFEGVDKSSVSVKLADNRLVGTHLSPGSTEFLANDITISLRRSREGEPQPKMLLVNNQGDHFKVPMGEYFLADGASAKNYRFACAVKATEKFKPVSILIIDLKEKKLHCEVPLPEDIEMENLWFYLSDTADAFVAVESKLKWGIVFDLLPQAKK